MHRVAPRLLAAALGLLLTVSALRAADPPDPLRLVPDQADFFVQVTQPRHLLEGVLGLDLLQRARGLDAVKEQLDSTNARRFAQLVAYFERESGYRWPEIVDRLAGGGIVLAGKFGADQPPALLVVQGRDEQLAHKYADLALEVATQELARQESKERPEKGTYRGIDTVHIGKQFHAAVAGSALLISNAEKSLHMALDLHLDGSGKSLASNRRVAEARKLQGGNPLALVWVNLEPAHQLPGAKELFTLPRDNFALTVADGGILDVVGRAPFVCAGVHVEGNGLVVRARIPRGLEGMPPALAAFYPPSDQPGSRPLLEPHGVVYSTSDYLDVAKFWDERTKLFTDKQVKSLEEFDQRSAPFLAGNRFSKLLQQAGPYERFVVAAQGKVPYKTTPRTAIPAFAWIVEGRDEELGRSANTILRAAALLATTQVRLRMTEEKHGPYTIVAYRFDENAPLKNDPNNLRFNFSPCFVTVGKQVVVSSTVELAHELVDLLDREKSAPEVAAETPIHRTQLYGEGGAELLQGFEDVLLTQTILDQALPPDEARQQVHEILDLVRRLGTVTISYGPGDRDFSYDIRFTPVR